VLLRGVTAPREALSLSSAADDQHEKEKAAEEEEEEQQQQLRSLSHVV
jgi:hypothetical protein